MGISPSLLSDCKDEEEEPNGEDQESDDEEDSESEGPAHYGTMQSSTSSK
jgi:hypothetical protein